MSIQYHVSTVIISHTYVKKFDIGRGVPNQIMRSNNQAQRLNHGVVPDSASAIQLFQAHRGQLTLFSDFGVDPLRDEPLKMNKEKLCSSNAMRILMIFFLL